MKKQELIHYHGLLSQIQNYIEEQNGEAIDMPEYDSLSVSPTSIHLGKPQHEKAVTLLIDGLVAADVDIPESHEPSTLKPIPADD